MRKISVLLTCLLFFVPYLHAQKKTVRTTFYQDGFLSKHQNDFSETIAEFKQNDVCIVLEYLGKDTYKIRYKGKMGYVLVDDLEVNESMMDLYYAYQDKAKQQAIEERKRKENNLAQDTEKVQDSLAKIKEQQRLALLKKQQSDSIAKVEEQKRLALIAQRKKDSLAKVKELERLELLAQKKADSIAEIKKQQRLALLEKLRLDSIAKVEEQKRFALIAQRKKDSLNNIKETERLKLLAKKRTDSIAKIKEQQQLALLKKQQSDSIAKVEEQKRLALIAQRKKDSLNNIKEIERLKLLAKKRTDSIAKIKAQQRLALLEKQRLDSITRVEAERKKLQELKSQEYLAKAKAEQEAKLKIEEEQNTTVTVKPKETSKPNLEKATRNTSCNYLINEYDNFYKIKNIQTEPYALNESLTVELYRHGKKLNLFFNLSESLGCASYMSHNRSSVKVKLENNQTISFYHSWSVECGNFAFKGRISTSQMAQLLNSPIKSILLRGTKSSKEITDITDKYFFIDKLHCLEVDF